MTKRTFFLTLREDILSILALVEQCSPLAFRLVRRYDNPTVPAITSSANLSDLGVATADCRNDEPTYLVMAASEELKIRAIERGPGKRFYWFNQADNPDSVFLTPAGRHTSGVILSGECVTASDSPGSKRLYDAIRRAIRSRCMRCGESCYIGPLAHQAAVDGVRLVDNVNYPESSDLRVPKRWRVGRA